MVYGVSERGNFTRLVKLVRSEIPLPLGAIQNSRSMVYVENLVSLIRCSAVHPDAAGQTFVEKVVVEARSQGFRYG